MIAHIEEAHWISQNRWSLINQSWPRHVWWRLVTSLMIADNLLFETWAIQWFLGKCFKRMHNVPLYFVRGMLVSVWLPANQCLMEVSLCYDLYVLKCHLMYNLNLSSAFVTVKCEGKCKLFWNIRYYFHFLNCNAKWYRWAVLPSCSTVEIVKHGSCIKLKK